MNFININIHDDVPRRLSEDEHVLHILGVIMTQVYNIKNGIKESSILSGRRVLLVHT
jgi:hypothetical protein